MTSFHMLIFSDENDFQKKKKMTLILTRNSFFIDDYMKYRHLAALDWFFFFEAREVKYFFTKWNDRREAKLLIFNLPINILSCDCQGQKQRYNEKKLQMLLAKIVYQF